MPNYRPIMHFGPDETERAGNALVFATISEARNSAAELYNRWASPTGYSVEKTDAPTTHRFDPIRGNTQITKNVKDKP